VDVCLIPEINTPLEGPGGVLAHVRRVLKKKQHCVVVVAEGAGQDILGKIGETDASGNPVLQNFAKFLKARPTARVHAERSFHPSTARFSHVIARVGGSLSTDR
jgi:6-phosphofructokinase 1